jgi:DNA-binding SARP family transcriptional activator/tetratricopeptide (TPR) repeat protein
LPRKDAALLAMLALESPVPRLRLYDRLWPGSPSERAATSLRQRLMRLRKASGLEPADKDDATVWLHPDMPVDVRRIETFEADAALAAGELLAGCEFGDQDDLDQWLQEARERCAKRLAERLVFLAEGAERRGDLAVALPLARRITQLLPLAEHAARREMRLHYLRGDRGAAIDACLRLESAMGELGLRPGAETLQAKQVIESSEVGGGLPRRPVPMSVRRPPRLVGREAAWLAMSRAWQDRRPFLLLAEAGLGKSRLLEAFVAERRDLVVESGRAGDEQAPYTLIARVLQQVQQRHGGGDFAQRFDARGAEPGTLWTSVERFLLNATARGLGALVVDDLHAADLATLQLLRWLAASPALRASLHLGFAARPFEPGPAADLVGQWLVQSGRPQHIELSPLTPAELAEMLASLALPSLLAPGVADLMHRRAGGHPLFTLALLEQALGDGLDVARGDLPRPPSVQALLTGRLARLPVGARELLAVAAVAGADLSVDLAARLLGASPLSLSEAWQALEAANVLCGERFVHDLMHEAALAHVPQGLQQSLHRGVAEALQDIRLQRGPQGSPGQPAHHMQARIAAHWEAGQQFTQAAQGWLRAAQAARDAARLDEQASLLGRAATCHRAAGEREAEFDARHAALESLLIRHGGRAVLDALPALDALALDGVRRLRVALARAEALIDVEDAEAALEESRRAVEQAERWPRWRADAQRLLGMALLQCRQPAEGLAMALRALASAESAGDDAQCLRAARSLAYVHYARGELAQALPPQRRALALADALPDPAEATAAEGSLAALLAVVGDAPGTYHHARGVRARYRDMGMAESSTLGAVNHILHGNAAAYLGKLGEAEDVLTEAVAMADGQAVAAAQAKARLALARLNLTLGRPSAARELLADVPAAAPVGMRMQVAWVFARAAAMEGLPEKAHWLQLGRLGAENPDVPYVVSAWYEWSFQGPAQAAIARLQRVCEECVAQGLPGAARAHATRLVARWLDIDTDEACQQAVSLARELMPHVEQGLTVRCYPPAVWLALADAFKRGAEAVLAGTCRERARQWVLERALPELPLARRDTFLRVNPINRAALADAQG